MSCIPWLCFALAAIVVVWTAREVRYERQVADMRRRLGALRAERDDLTKT